MRGRRLPIKQSSLGARVSSFGVIALTLATVSVVIGAFYFVRVLDERTVLVDQVDPAQSTSRDYLAALIDQEAAVRGFLLTGDQEFLLRYQRGGEVQRATSNRIQRLLRDQPTLRNDFLRAHRLADEWTQQSASAAIASKQSGAEINLTDAELGRTGKRFGSFLSAFDTYSNKLAEFRDLVLVRLDRGTYVLAAVLILGIAVMATVGFRLRVGYGNWVAQPLRRLGDDAQQVANGDLSHTVTPSGPREIAVLGSAIEGMRTRILADLEEVRLAREDLLEQTDELARSNAELEQFAYVASHDLQEPLRKVVSFCQLLQKRYGGQLDDRADQYIGFAVDGAQRMQLLINDLLAFSRIGRVTPAFSQVDTEVALHMALENLKLTIEETGAGVTSTGLPEVLGDLTLLTSLFQNLVENAIKFRRPGVAPVVRIGAEIVEDEWIIRVGDNGIGIDPSYAERIFVIFQRLHPKEEYPGTGIGLALCRKIVEYHGGRIWIDPGSQGGTTFVLALPALIGGSYEQPLAG